MRDNSFQLSLHQFQALRAAISNSYGRQISSWVGDDQRIPGVVCFFLVTISFSPSVLQTDFVG